MHELVVPSHTHTHTLSLSLSAIMHELVVSSGLQPGDFAGCGQVTPSELSVEPIPSSFNAVPVYARPHIHAYTRFVCLNVYVYMYVCTHA